MGDELDLISPELDFGLFCLRVKDRDLLRVMDAAGVESSRILREHRQRTGRSFRRGSRQERYCNNLSCLVGMLVNGRYPDTADAAFFGAVLPLARHLLQRWQIGNLRDVFSPENIASRDKEAALHNPLLAVILEAREQGRAAASAVYEGWRTHYGDRQQYDCLATAVLHLSVRPKSVIGKQLADVAANHPHLVRVDRDFEGSGLVIDIHDMVNGLEQGMNIAAEEAALKVLQERLQVKGHVTSHAS